MKFKFTSFSSTIKKLASVVISVAITSVTVFLLLKSMESSTVTDQYYYVDEAGNRTPIDETCVSIFGTGGFSRTIQEEDIDIIYIGLKLSKDNCSEAFMTAHFDSQLNEYYVLKTYYGIDTEKVY